MPAAHSWSAWAVALRLCRPFYHGGSWEKTAPILCKAYGTENRLRFCERLPREHQLYGALQKSQRAGADQVRLLSKV